MKGRLLHKKIKNDSAEFTYLTQLKALKGISYVKDFSIMLNDFKKSKTDDLLKKMASVIIYEYKLEF